GHIFQNFQRFDDVILVIFFDEFSQLFNNRYFHYPNSFTNSFNTSALLVCSSFTNLPSWKIANVCKLVTEANFLDLVNFSASAITKVIPSFSVESFLNFGFMIRQLPHHDAAYCTATFSLLFTISCKLSCSNSFSIIIVFFSYKS